MARHKLIMLDLSGVLRLQGSMEALHAVMSGKAHNDVVDVINRTAKNVQQGARDRMIEGMNLNAPYVDSKFLMVEASKSRWQATIIARGGRDDMTRLVHYGAHVKTEPMKAQKHRGSGIMLRVLGIPQGRKQVATHVQVRRGAPKTREYMFMLPLKQGTKQGNKAGVFTRKGKKITHRYGPSVYQLFSFQLNNTETMAFDELQAALYEQLTAWENEVFA